MTSSDDEERRTTRVVWKTAEKGDGKSNDPHTKRAKKRHYHYICLVMTECMSANRCTWRGEPRTRYRERQQQQQQWRKFLLYDVDDDDDFKIIIQFSSISAAGSFFMDGNVRAPLTVLGQICSSKNKPHVTQRFVSKQAARRNLQSTLRWKWFGESRQVITVLEVHALLLLLS